MPLLVQSAVRAGRLSAVSTTRILIVATASVIALLAVAPSMATGATQTRAEFIAAADPICAQAGSRIENLSAAAVRLVDKDRFNAAGIRFLRASQVVSSTTAQLRAIGPPPPDAALIGQWLAVYDESVGVIAQLGRATKQRAVKRIGRLGRRVHALDKTADAIVAGYGFTPGACVA